MTRAHVGDRKGGTEDIDRGGGTEDIDGKEDIDGEVGTEDIGQDVGDPNLARSTVAATRVGPPNDPVDDHCDRVALEMDLGPSGVALDLSASDWPQHVEPALAGLYGDSSTAVALEEVSRVVAARASQLARCGASSLILLPTGNELAPIAVGAVFVRDGDGESRSTWTNELETTGWQVSATTLSGSIGVRGHRRSPVPGAAGLTVLEEILVAPAAACVFVVTVHGIWANFCPPWPKRRFTRR